MCENREINGVTPLKISPGMDEKNISSLNLHELLIIR